MPELQEDLRTYIDALAARAEAGAADSAVEVRVRPRPRNLVLAACVATLVLVGTVLIAVTDDDRDERVITSGPEPTSASVPAPKAGEWERLPTTLSGPDSHTSLFWTGEALLILHPENGGGDVAGEIYRPADDTVRPMAPSGLEWRAFPAVVWTGEEMIVAGGSNGPGIDTAAAAYDPATDRWRVLPAPPGFALGRSEGPIGAPAVWTGKEMVAWRSGLAFDPARERWRALPRAPLEERTDEAVTAMGPRIFVWGGCNPARRPQSPQCDETTVGDELTDGAVYDPEADTWTAVPAGPLGPGSDPSAVWTGEEVIVTVRVPADPDRAQVAAYDPERRSWRTLPAPPTPIGRYGVAVWAGDLMVQQGGGTEGRTGPTLALDPRSNRWFRLPDGPERSYPSAVWIGDRIAVAGGHPDASPWALRLTE